MGDVYNDNIDGIDSTADYKIICNGVEVATFTENGLTIDGDFEVTGISPDKLLFKQNTTISHTGTLEETKIFSVLIPTGTFQANDFMNFHFHLNATNNANVKTCRVYCNTTDDLSGSPILLATRTVNSFAGMGVKRTLAFNNSLTSQEIVQPTAIITTDEAASVATSTLAIDFTVKQYFIITFQLESTSDTISLRHLRTWINR